MKSKDIVPLLIVVVISSILAFILSSWLVPDTPESREVQTIQGITADFKTGEELEEVFHDHIIDTFGELILEEEE